MKGHSILYDIIPDIHGQADKLTGLLTQLGYRERNGAWRHSDPTRGVVFLGDFIDRGPENAKVIRIVREMIDASTAQAIMGNHELNAIHFHTPHNQTGTPLRPHSHKNLKQHASFLAELPVGSKATTEAITWMKSLPIFLEIDGFRAVHACWSETAITAAQPHLDGGIFNENAVQISADEKHPLFHSTEILLKGPEIELPEGYSFTDKDDHQRNAVRLAWWNSRALTYREAAMSVPNIADLPDTQLPPGASKFLYGSDQKPVFFGHYWLTGEPVLQAKNAFCLDYSAGRDGPLIAYTFEEGCDNLSLEHVSSIQ